MFEQQKTAGAGKGHYSIHFRNDSSGSIIAKYLWDFWCSLELFGLLWPTLYEQDLSSL